MFWALKKEGKNSDNKNNRVVKPGLRKSRISTKFKLSDKSLKKQIQSYSFRLQFWTKEKKKLRLKFNLRVSANQPSNNWPLAFWFSHWIEAYGLLLEADVVSVKLL